MRTPLAILADEALRALERPEEGFVLDDFDARYRRREHTRDAKSADWFYRNKSAFESVYASALDDTGKEPAWVSDGGRGADELLNEVAYLLDGDERAEDHRTPSMRERRWQAALKRVRRLAPHCLATLKLIRKNGTNRKESIWELAKATRPTKEP